MTLPAFITTIGRPAKKPPMSLVRELVTGISEMAGIPPELVFTKDRRQGVAWVKAMVCRWLRAHENGYSTTGIGEKLGIDHSSVLHLVNREWPTIPPKLNKRYEPGAPKPAPPKIITMPPRNKRLGEQIMSLVPGYESTDCKIVPEEIANRLRVSQSNAAGALLRLCAAGRIQRIGPGSYRPLPRPKPVVVLPSVAHASFIRPPSLARLMGSR